MSRVRKAATVFFLCCAVFGSARAAGEVLPPALAKAAAALHVNPAGVTLSVVELTGPGRFSWAADRQVAPASTAKLVTTLAALETLGADYRWRTGFFAETLPDAKGVLKGPLYLRGGGDPLFLLEDFAMAIERLAQLGVKRIEGDVVLDRTLFDLPPHDPGAFDGRPDRPYNLGADGMLINFRSLELEFFPDPKKGVARVVTMPRLAGVAVPASVPLEKGPCGDWKTRIGLRFQDAKASKKGALPGKQAVFLGKYPLACGEKTLNTVPFEADDYAGRLFRALWEKEGRSWSGRVLEGRTPEKAKALLVHTSPALSEIVFKTNKWSNNPMARHLFLSLGLGALTKDAQGKTASAVLFPGRGVTPEDARNVLKGWLESRGIPPDTIWIENGSGLSRTSRVTARSMTALLAAGWEGPYMMEFAASLPITGEDGTMKKRRVALSRGRIKTGYLSGVRSIGGYIQSADGRRWALYGSVTGGDNMAHGIDFLDAVIEWVYEGAKF